MLQPMEGTEKNIDRIVFYVDGWPMSVLSMYSQDKLRQRLLLPTTMIGEVIPDIGEKPVGVVILEEVEPDKHSARLNLLFWNRRPAEFSKEIFTIVGELLNEFQLSRIDSIVPICSHAIANVLHRVGFRKEGTLRGYMPDGQGCYIYSILRGEYGKLKPVSEKFAIRLPGHQSDVPADSPVESTGVGRDATGEERIPGLVGESGRGSDGEPAADVR